MSDTGASASASRSRIQRWILAALVASLALNLIIAGSVAGAMWRFHRPPLWAGNVTPNLLGYASTLPAERRKQLWDGTAEQRASIRPARRELRAARNEVTEALSAEPFDNQRFLAAHTKLLDVEHRARLAVQPLYSEIAARLTPDERRGYARWREYRRPANQNLLDEPDHPAQAR